MLKYKVWDKVIIDKNAIIKDVGMEDYMDYYREWVFVIQEIDEKEPSKLFYRLWEEFTHYDGFKEEELILVKKYILTYDL